jgi:hypothetical protein
MTSEAKHPPERKLMSRQPVIVGLALVLTLCTTSMGNAQPAISFEKPLALRVTGQILKFVDPPPEDFVTANISVQDQRLLLRIGRVEELDRLEREQAVTWGVLFREILFTGPEEELQHIRNAEGAGKAITIDGFLDTKTRQFLVSSVSEAKSARPKP